jgi:alkanesulfonate monooxygenase SsuD/methylene tetrahydromethanopterin reductase-like flavin-dependent oxidoreductase (luciferase family)
VQVHLFHLMPWPHMPADFEQTHDSAWVTFSNSHFDPERGADVYAEYLDQLELALKLGFDGVAVNEHHQNAYGLMPSPNVMAAALARRTSRGRIILMGNGIPLRNHPLRIAEEVALLDVVSGGRIVSGFVRGIGAEYLSLNFNPAFSRERWDEAHDLIVQAWTRAGPFAFRGKHYNFEYVNVWPRPLQQPHPPIWYASQGSLETIELASRHRYPYFQSASSLDSLKRSHDLYRELAQRAGYTAGPELLGWGAMVFVGETDSEAYDEAMRYCLYFYNKHFVLPRHFLFPAGYLSEQSMERVLGAKVGLGVPGKTVEDLERMASVVAGSPLTVRQKLIELQKDIGFGLLSASLHRGNMPHEVAMRNIELFAKEVMPHLQANRDVSL